MGPSILTSRQAEELHKSMIAYLLANNLPNSAAALRAELNLGDDVFDPVTTKKYETLLEKKWTSIIRLQKKMMKSESRIAALQSELDNATPMSLPTGKQDRKSWLPKSPQHTLESHRDIINCVAFHPIYSTIASGSDDYTIKIWDWELGELEKTIKGHTRPVLDVDYGGPRGGILLASCSSDFTIKLWDPADDYKNIRTLAGHDHSVSAVRFIPSGNLLVSASRDKSLKIWDVTTGYCVTTLLGHTQWVRAVHPSFDGRFLFSTGDDMTARLWDISTSKLETKQIMVAHEHYSECCALAPPITYQYLASLAGLKKAPPANSSAEFMVTGSRDKTIKLWDAHGNCLRTLVGHDNWVRALVFHPGGKYLISASDDKTLRCWDLSQEGKCVKVLKDTHERFITCLKWAPDMVKEVLPVYGGIAETQGDEGNRTPNSRRTEAGTSGVHIRCVLATGGEDKILRIFAN